MRLLVMSDLHLEFRSLQLPDPGLYDVVVLAGDVHSKGRSTGWASDNFHKPVVMVGGNHELYGAAWHKAFARLESNAKPHVHFLERQSVVVEGVRFVGCVCWSDFESTGNSVLAMLDARQMMNDYRQIRLEPQYSRITPTFIRRQAQESRQWLHEEISKPHPGKTVVVTHHPPLMKFVPHYDKHPHLSASYGNQWEEFLDLKIDLWVFGHTHWPIDETLRGVRFVSNPRGYPQEDLSFNPELVVEL
ncbi:serine/threonine protein phosphatase [Pseudomonas cichorii]|jgi:predicted phosphodiesterase|uniref:metallophosphoesterase n=1 Tax=Pseudomonas cichorii TaxID=36746 RepID=UPI001F317F90|nr:metallophosphoesterase [Pseudomonas cichorii]GFM86341.1 serine/threonine protein phosphatase [Pseudomonas cichorii]